jgi:hypothetical protein
LKTSNTLTGMARLYAAGLLVPERVTSSST